MIRQLEQAMDTASAAGTPNSRGGVDTTCHHPVVSPFGRRRCSVPEEHRHAGHLSQDPGCRAPCPRRSLRRRPTTSSPSGKTGRWETAQCGRMRRLERGKAGRRPTVAGRADTRAAQMQQMKAGRREGRKTGRSYRTGRNLKEPNLNLTKTDRN